jgi:hypothetical protein
MTEAKGNIGKAILKVMKEVGYVQKESKSGLPYSFAGEAALIKALRPAMIKHGVHCYVSDILEIGSGTFTTKSGAVMNHVAAHGVVRFDHPISDTHIDVHAMGEGMDSGDKAGNKAATGLLKYALRQTFLIETGDDPDANSSAEMERAQAFADKQTPKSTNGDVSTKFWQLVNRLEWEREAGLSFIEDYGGDMDKALKELEAQHGGPSA